MTEPFIYDTRHFSQSKNHSITLMLSQIHTTHHPLILYEGSKRQQNVNAFGSCRIVTYCFPVLMNPFILLPLLVTEAFPPRPTTKAVKTALLPPVITANIICHKQ